jgi:sec-independent protein translocase protein TatA
MDYFSIWRWLIVGAILVLVFGGRGKISELMGDAAKGIKAFKKGMAAARTLPISPRERPTARRLIHGL